MAPRKLTVQWIREKCTGESFSIGERHYRQGDVLSARIRHGVVTAQVTVSTTYEVRVPLVPTEGEHVCKCHGDGPGLCRHAVAVLLYALSNLESLLGEEKESGRSGTAFDAAFDGVPYGRLKEFMVSEMRKDAKMWRRFLTRVGTHVTGDYRDEMEAVYGEAYVDGVYDEKGREVKVRLGEFFEAAGMREREGNHDEAARIYAAISETVSENAYRQDDSSGIYNDYHDRAVRALAASMTRQPDGEQRRRNISYLVGRLRRERKDYLDFRNHYRAALRTVCAGAEDREYWRSLERSGKP